jgi:hypothetical protein
MVERMVDFVLLWRASQLGSSEKANYEVGEHAFSYKIDTIDFAGVKQRYAMCISNCNAG